MKAATVSNRVLSAVALTMWVFFHPCDAWAEAKGASDAWITARTKVALIADNAPNAANVHVDTLNGNVVLYGKVKGPAEKEKAASIAQGISGVKSVSNLLQVVDAADRKAIDTADARIKTEIQKRLDADTSLVKSHVYVKSVNNGAVLLAGKIATLSDHLRAVVTASDVPGVRSIASETPSRGAVVQYDPAAASEEIKDVAKNGWLATATRLRLLGDPDVPALDVGVDAKEGTVTLFGTVPSEKAKQAALADAQKVDPSVTVKDEIKVDPAAKPPVASSAGEAAVRRTVDAALKARPGLDKVEVEVTDGVARLTGKVESGWARLKAGVIARAQKGVRAVKDDLHL